MTNTRQLPAAGRTEPIDLNGHFTIVLVKVEEVQAGRRFDGRLWRPHPSERTVRAAVWLRRGSGFDVPKAHEFADREGYRVFLCPTSERDPLGAAKAWALAEADRG